MMVESKAADARSGSLLISRARLVSVGVPAPTDRPVDIRIADGLVSEVASGLRPLPGEQVIDAADRWAIPGLWDHHVHMIQWSQTRSRLDVGGTDGPDAVTRIVGDHIARLPANRPGTVVSGYGFRSATWSRQPTVAELDRVSGDHPVVLTSGDGHNGWLNSAALALLGTPQRTGALTENEWFALMPGIVELTAGMQSDDRDLRAAVRDASSRGVVGIVDFELARGYLDWPERFANGIDSLRVRSAVYPDGLEEVLAAGLRTGQPLPHGAGLATMGPLKIISDGSLNTRTAHCREPYADGGELEHPSGQQNFDLTERVSLLGHAHAGGLQAAVHAIGDAAVGIALDAFASTGVSGSVEHAQLTTRDDLTRMGRLGVRASVQPAHLLDDREVTAQCWPDRADRCFAFVSMLSAGVGLRFGSDAPVAPLDPWLAMAAAVHRSADERDPWNPGEAISAAEALAASTDGQTTLAVGGRGDVVVLDDNPVGRTRDTATAAARLRERRVAATIVAGRLSHIDL